MVLSCCVVLLLPECGPPALDTRVVSVADWETMFPKFLGLHWHWVRLERLSLLLPRFMLPTHSSQQS